MNPQPVSSKTTGVKLDFEYDLRYLQAAVDELESYLLSDDLFWPIHGSPPSGTQPFPRLTIGALSLAQKRASALARNREDTWQVDQVTRRFEVARQKWRLRWEEKSHRELLSRLLQWRNYLQEYRQEPERHAAYYAYEVRWRVLVELLEMEVDSLNENENELQSGLDLILRAVFLPGNFIWLELLQPAFPSEKYWYLYGQPRASS